MSKKIILGILILTILGGVAYFIWASNGQTTPGSPQSTFNFRSFLPFGNSDDFVDNTPKPSTDKDEPSGEPDQSFQSNQPAPKLRKVSDAPVAGMTFLNVGSATQLRYIEKATGNIYEARGDILDLKRLTNTTIPKVNRAFWLPQGDGVLVQTVNENDFIETSFIKLKAIKATTTTETSVSYETAISKLPTGIQEISIRPDGKKIVYYLKTGISDWFISNPDGTERVNFYQNNIQNWLPQWYSNSLILLTTKASASSLTYGYTLNVSNNQLSKVLSGFVGGGALASTDGKNFLSSDASNRSTNLFLVKNNTVEDIKIKTFPEKCAWDPSNSSYIVCAVPKHLEDSNYPESWYQGKTNTDDLIERINISDKFFYLISDLKEGGGSAIDVRDMSVSAKGDYAAFLNKNDSTLWLLRIKE